METKESLSALGNKGLKFKVLIIIYSCWNDNL